VRRATTAVLTATAVVAATLGVAAAPSSAEPTTLTLPHFTGMAVDEAHDTVLITSGKLSSDITVLGLDGTPSAPIGDMAGARDVHLSDDGSVFYISLETEHAIGVVDAATLEATKIPLGTDVCPVSVTQAAEVLWFAYTDCVDDESGRLGSLQLADSTVTLGLAPDGVQPDGVQASAALPGSLVVRSSPALVMLDVSEGPTAPALEVARAEVDALDFSITPDGTEVIATDRPRSRHVGLSPATMTVRTVYPTGGQTRSVAIRDDGLVAAGLGAAYSDDLFLFHAGDPTLFRSYDLPGRATLRARGLAFGETDLYLMFEEGVDTFHFDRLTPRLEPAMSMSRGRTIYDYGDTAEITVHLSQPGALVRVYATPYGGTKRLLATAPVDAEGNLRVTLPVRVRTTFTAYFDGDAEYDPAHAWISVATRAHVTAKATKVVGHYGAYNLVKVRTAPRVYATVRPYHVDQCVRYQFQQYSSRWRTTHTSGCIRLNEYSKTYVWFDSSWQPGDRLRLRVLWDGDTKNAKARSSWLYLRFVS
jgi:hypothetical protein